MNLLLDTHTFLWWIAGDAALSPAARDAIADEANGVHVSAASSWEIATRFRLGKLPGVAAIVGNLSAVLDTQGFRSLAVSFAHGATAGRLPGPNKDPFDRMLISQAMTDGLILVSNEERFDAYGVHPLW